jgi:NAD(P) transhydrogenase subunit alpha
MRIAVPRETAKSERRVALVPESVLKLTESGFQIALERGAGIAAGFHDAAYEEAGARLAEQTTLLDDADAVVRVAPPSPADAEALRAGMVLIGFLAPLTDREGIERLRTRGVIAFAMESIPRTTRAQPMDALSSQATIAGYEAALIAADRASKMFPMLMTAAGTIAPARVLVLGAGVAGLQAIATTRRLGAVVSAFDVRAAVKEQVESLGASFLELGVRAEEATGGYATELTREDQARQLAALEERIADVDVVITTALVPGRPAPLLIPKTAVARMRSGSVIVDVAAEAGGNCELTVPDEEVDVDGVTVVGYTNLPSRLPFDASRLYARNVSAFVEHLAPGGELRLDFDDEITAGACVVRPKEVAA